MGSLPDVQSMGSLIVRSLTDCVRPMLWVACLRDVHPVSMGLVYPHSKEQPPHGL